MKPTRRARWAALLLAAALCLAMSPQAAAAYQDRNAVFTGTVIDFVGYNALNQPEYGYALRLDTPYYLDPAEAEYSYGGWVEEIQLAGNASSELGRYLSRHVTVTGEAFEAHTSHHHRPIVMLVDTITETPLRPTVSPFVDVYQDSYYADAVEWAVAAGITKGTSSTTFSPRDPCTRAQVVTFLWRYAETPDPGRYNPFRDVANGAYYRAPVLWAVSAGIANGLSSGAFGPERPCTRAQVVTFLWRYAGSPVVPGRNPFRDVSAGDYYYDAVLWAVSAGVTSGTSDTAFSPGDPCTRAQVVTFLWNLCG